MAVESFVKNTSSIFLLLLFVLNIAHPVARSFTIEFNKALSLFSVKSSKLFAIVNRVNGLYSSAVILNL